MIIERNSKEVIIRLPASVNTDDLQDFIDYARYKELTSKSKASQKEVDDLADQINIDWWNENRSNFIK
jgi:predicted nucleotide-binding protein (sugar kinase/HSP70/actin superfamily)